MPGAIRKLLAAGAADGSRSRRLLAAAYVFVFALGAGLRFSRALRAGTIADAVRSGRPDYFELARGLSQWGVLGRDGRPDAFRAPAYPALLALTESFDPAFRARAPFVHAALGVGAMGLAAWAAAGLAGPWAGAAAAGLIAAQPALLSEVAGYQIEPLYGALVAGALLALLAWVRSPSRGSAAALGLAVGASVLCRSPLCLLLPAAAVVWRLRSRPTGGLWLAFAVACACLLPWIARNALQFHRLIPLESDPISWNLFAGSGAAAAGRRFPVDAGARLRLGLAGIAARPGAYLASCAARLGRAAGLHWLLAALAGLALWRRRRDEALMAAAGFCAYFLLVHAPLGLRARYIEPLVPCLAVLAAAFLPGGAPPARAWSRRAVVLSLALSLPVLVLTTAALARETALSRLPCAVPTRLGSLYCGERLAAHGDLAGARRAWRRGIDSPGLIDAARVRLWLDDATCGPEQTAEGRARIEAAAQLDPEASWRKALELGDAGRWPQARLVLEAVARRYPDDARFLADRGMARYMTGERAAGARDWRRAAAMDPRCYRCWLDLGSEAERLGRWRQAEADYTAGIRAHPAGTLEYPPSPYWTPLIEARSRVAGRLAALKRTAAASSPDRP